MIFYIYQTLKLEIKNKHLIVNRAPEPMTPELDAKIKEAVAESDLPLGGIFPSSDDLIKQEITGASYLKLADDVPVVQTAFTAFDKIFA